MPHSFNLAWLELSAAFNALNTGENVSLAAEALDKIKKNRAYLEKKISASDALIYGINTGFGSLCDVEIKDAQICDLQHNLIRSHACGQGALVQQDISRLILWLKIKNMSLGYSGIRPLLIDQLIKIYNSGLAPVIYEQGSLGASGDLAPLAHMSLPLIGEGEVWMEGKKVKAKDALRKKGIKPIELSFKEGLALINGTQFSLAHSIWAIYHAHNLMRWANTIAALSLDVYHCSLKPFESCLHRIRQQEGQVKVAQKILKLLEGSEIGGAYIHSVQDPYSFRCIPQVHGATKDALEYANQIIERELNAVTDNPNVFEEEDMVLSGGNFHAQPLAITLDFMAIALSELASISERRIYKLINGDRELPAYLTKIPGLHSGFMIAQYTAASIVSQNKQLCTPASVDSITSSKGQEDHVSMAANAATKLKHVVDNVYRVLAIELMTAMQGLDLRRPQRTSDQLENIYARYRAEVSTLHEDRVLSYDMDTTVKFMKNYKL